VRILESPISAFTVAALAVVSLGARPPHKDLGRATLAAGDGWASSGAGHHRRIRCDSRAGLHGHDPP
jgi:hypothetical protein